MLGVLGVLDMLGGLGMLDMLGVLALLPALHENRVLCHAFHGALQRSSTWPRAAGQTKSWGTLRLAFRHPSSTCQGQQAKQKVGAHSVSLSGTRPPPGSPSRFPAPFLQQNVSLFVCLPPLCLCLSICLSVSGLCLSVPPPSVCYSLCLFLCLSLCLCLCLSLSLKIIALAKYITKAMKVRRNKVENI